MATRKVEQEKTTLDTDVTKPSVTAPGDGPADTTDPRELASTVPARPGPEAHKVGTVNATVKVGEIEDREPEGEHRIEEYEAVKPDGSKVTVVHNIDTGETRIK